MKKNKINKKNLIMFIVLILCIVITPIYFKTVYLGHDGAFHYQRIEQLALSMKNGVLFPTIHSGALGGQGYASSLFYPDLFILIPAFFVLIGFSKYTALSIFIFILNILTFAISYIVMKEFLKDNKELNDNEYTALMGAVAYTIYPYRLWNIVVRCAVSETLAMTFVPLIALAYYKIFIKKDYKAWKLLSLGFTLIVLSHLGSALIMAIVGVIVLMCNYKVLKDKEFYINMLKAVALALLLTSYFLIPMLEQMMNGEYLYQLLPTINDPDLNPNKTIDVNTKTIISQNINQYLLCLINVLIVYIGLKFVSYIKNKFKLNKKESYVMYSTMSICYLLIMTTNIFPWTTVKNILPVIQQIQFPFRFYIIGAIPFALILGLGVVYKGNDLKLVITKILTLVFISSLLINFGGLIWFISPTKERINNEPLFKNSYLLGYGEFIPAYYDNIEYQVRLAKEVNDIDTITTTVFLDDETQKIKSKKMYNKLVVSLKDNLMLNNEDSTYDLETEILNYKGYRAYIDGKEFEITNSSNGRIRINSIPTSSKELIIKYERTTVQSISTLVSATTLLTCIGLKVHNQKNKNKEYERAS